MLTMRDLRREMEGLPDDLVILVRIGRHEKLHELKRLRFRGKHKGPSTQQYLEMYVSRYPYPFLAQPHGARRDVVVAVRNAAPPRGAGQEPVGPHQAESR